MGMITSKYYIIECSILLNTVYVNVWSITPVGAYVEELFNYSNVSVQASVALRLDHQVEFQLTDPIVSTRFWALCLAKCI